MENLNVLADALPVEEDFSVAVPSRTELVSQLEITSFESPDALRSALAELGIEDPSKSLMKRLADKMNIFKCCRCAVVCDTEQEFIDHLKVEKHLYGQKAYAEEKRTFLKRVKKSFAERNILHAFIPDGVESYVEFLQSDEIQAWNCLDRNADLTPGQIATFHNLVHVGICLVRIRRDHVVR